MYEAILKSISNSIDSFVIYKSLDWDSSELKKGIRDYQTSSNLNIETWDPSKLLLIDNYEEFSWEQRKKLSPYLYDAERVIYLKNPFYEKQEVEKIFHKSKKVYFILNLFQSKTGSKVRFIKLGLLSPRLRVLCYNLIRLYKVKKNHLCLRASCANEAELFQFLAQGAKRRRNCYILGMSKPKVWK